MKTRSMLPNRKTSQINIIFFYQKDSAFLFLKCIFFVLIFFSYFSSISAQPKSFSTKDSIQGDLFYRLADENWKNVDTCKHYSLLAIPLLKKSEQWEKYIYTLCGLNACYNTKQQYDSMETSIKFTIEEAERVLPPNHDLYFVALNNLAIVYSEIKEDDLKALSIYKNVYRLLQRDPPIYHYKAPNEENIGDMYYRLGDFQTSINYYQQAIENWQKVTVKGKTKIPYPRLAKTFERIANVHFSSKAFHNAKENAIKSIETLKSSDVYDKVDEISLTLNLCKINIALNNFEQALNQIQKQENKKELTPLLKARLYYLKALAYLKKGNPQKAIENLTISLQVPVPESKFREKAISHRTLAQAYLELEKPNLALKYFQSSTRLLTSSSLKNNLDSPDATTTVSSKLELFKTLVEKGKTIQHLHQQTNELKYLEANLKNYLYLSQLTNDIRSFYQSDESELLLLEVAKNFYEDAIETATLLYDKTKDEQYLEHAFFFTEKSKSELLLEELRKKEFSGRGIIADSLLAQRYELKTAILFNEKMIKKENAKTKTDASKIKSLEDDRFELENQLITLRDAIQKNYPNYTALTNQQPITIQQLQKELKEEQVVLEYFVGEKNIYLFKITTQTKELLKLENDFGLDSLIQDLFDHLKMEGENGVHQFTSVAYDIYKKILSPARITPNQNHLIIIPDGQLENLPFDILVTENEKVNSPKKLPYLIKNFTTSYAYSATIFSHQMKQNIQEPTSLIGVFPTFEQTEKELLFNQQIYQTLSRFSGDYFQDEAANIKNFLDHIEHHQVIHFSTHAKGLDSIYNEPSIDFEDGTLNLSDLQTYNLSAALAVLSACETNTGTYRKGEGIMSLSRGFTFAGVPSIITSTSNVFEESTSTLMQSLYQNLEQQMPKHEALRQAKVAYLTDPNLPISKSSPYYWGTFLVVGNTDSITFEYPTNKMNWILLGLGFLAFLIFYWKKRTQ